MHVNLRKLHDIQIRQRLPDIEVASRMRVELRVLRRICGRDRTRGKAIKKSFDEFVAFCQAIDVDPVRAFSEILEDE